MLRAYGGQHARDGGGGGEACGGVINEDYIIELIDRKIYKNMMENYKKVNIVRTKLGSTAGLLGAAYAAAQL